MKTEFDLTFSEEQAMMLETAEAFCADKSPMEFVRQQLEKPAAFNKDVWQEITDLGWPGIAVPEQYGGAGLRLAEAVPVLEAMGRNLMTTPYMGSLLGAEIIKLMGSDEQKNSYLPRICNGEIVSVAVFEESGDWDLSAADARGKIDGDQVRLEGAKVFACDLEEAALVLVSAQIDGRVSFVLLDREEVGSEHFKREVILDETRRSYRLGLNGLAVSKDQLLCQGEPLSCVKQIEMTACLLLGAEMCGGHGAVMDLTVEYLNTRQQFGRFIGAYQGLKHPMADILTDYEGGRSLLYHAATVFDREEEREEAVRMLKSWVGDAFLHAADRSVQFHGAFGFTYDCDAQLFLRRALWCQSQYGDSDYHRDALEELLLGAA